MKKPTPKLKFAVLAADTALFTFENKELLVRLIKVDRPPYYANHWGLPGGLIDPKETADRAAWRHLWGKGGVKNAYLEQLYTFSGIHRDPRGRVVAVAYLGLGQEAKLKYKKDSDQKYEACWFSVKELPHLAYDHAEVIKFAFERLKSKLTYTNIAFTLMPKRFTLTELQNLYEKILHKRLDRRNFRKKILSLRILLPVKEELRGLANRPAALYRFKSDKLKLVEII